MGAPGADGTPSQPPEVSGQEHATSTISDVPRDITVADPVVPLGADAEVADTPAEADTATNQTPGAPSSSGTESAPSSGVAAEEIPGGNVFDEPRYVEEEGDFAVGYEEPDLSAVPPGITLVEPGTDQGEGPSPWME
jgi:hypothetical protein